MQETRHNLSQTCTYGVPQSYAAQTTQIGSTQTTPFSSGSMSELLRSSLGDTRFPDTGYQHRTTSRSAPSSGLYLADRSQHFQAESKISPQSPILWSPFDQRMDSDSQTHSYTRVGSTPMWSQGDLSQVMGRELIAADNDAYMCLFKQNLQITGQLEALEKAYTTLVSAQGASHHATEEIRDTTPENPENYPKITYWRKCTHLDERYRWEEFTKSGEVPRCRGRKSQAESKDVAFWHFQHADGTMITHEEQLKIQAKSKKIWATQCEKGTIGSPWTTVSPT